MVTFITQAAGRHFQINSTTQLREVGEKELGEVKEIGRKVIEGRTSYIK